MGALGERFDLVLFMGVLYHLRHPLLALDLIHEHVAGDLLVFQSMQRGSDEVEPVDADYPFFDRGHVRPAGLSRSCTSSSSATPAIRPTGGCPTAPASRRCCAAPGFAIVEHPEEEVFVCRRRAVEFGPDGPHAVYPARGRTA